MKKKVFVAIAITLIACVAGAIVFIKSQETPSFGDNTWRPEDPHGGAKQ